MTDLATITRAIEDVAAVTKGLSTDVSKQIADILAHTSTSDARILDLEQKILTRGAAPGPGDRGAGAIDIGAAITKSMNFDDLKNRFAWVRNPIAGSLRQIMKSVLVNTGTSGTSPETGFPTIGELLPGGPFGFTHRRLSVLQALTSVPVTTAKVEFPKLTTNSDAAAVQSDEGAAKAESNIGFTMETLEAATVAHFVTCSRQVLADSPLLVEFLNQVMLFGALKKFENLIVSGNGTSDKVSGLLTQGTAYLPGADHSSDMIGEMLAALTALGFTPDLVIINAQDYFDIISARDTNHRYIAGGWSAASPTNLWGVFTVPTAALNRGTVIGLDTSVVRVLDREEANLQVGYQNDDFVKNQVSLVAELRGNLAVQNPDGVFVMNIGNDSP
jgi:HK97 family phage major capsid protein